MKKTLVMALAATTALSTGAFAEEITEFRIGILGGENAQDRMNSYQCLADYTTEVLGVETKLFAPADYNGVIQGLLGGTIDMAWLGASSYAATYLQDPDAVDPVLIKVNVDGSIGYHSIGFARIDSGIASLDDMEGKVFGFGDPNSTSGYLIPSIEIPQYKDGVTMESGEYFGEVKFTGGHEQTIVAVNNGDIDGGVTWADAQGNWEDGNNSGALRKAVDAGLVDMNEMVQIWKSNVIPEGPVVLRKALPDEVRATMTALVDGLHERDADCAYGVAAGDTLGFQPVTHDTYISIVEARKAKIGGYAISMPQPVALIRAAGISWGQYGGHFDHRRAAKRGQHPIELYGAGAPPQALWRSDAFDLCCAYGVGLQRGRRPQRGWVLGRAAPDRGLPCRCSVRSMGKTR